MPERDRTHYFFNGREIGRLLIRTRNHTARMLQHIWRGYLIRTRNHTARVLQHIWRGYLIRIAYTNPSDTRLDPHHAAPVRETLAEPVAERVTHIAPTIDKIYIRKSVLDAIVAGAWNYPDLETGEALVGVVPPITTDAIRVGEAAPEQAVYLLGTISPDESTIREWGTVQMGDEDQYDHFLWLAENWYEDQEADKRWGDLPLQHLGDWHKQPGGMTAPSRGDFHSAKEFLSDRYWHLPFILQPIVTLPRRDSEPPRMTNQQGYLIHADEQGRQARIDFWYLNQRMNQYEYVLDIAVLGDKESGSLPQLAPLPWNLRDPERMNFEEYHLNQERRSYEAFYFNSEGLPPLEYCLLVGLPAVGKRLLIATQYDHPKQPPVAWWIPLPPGQNDRDSLERLRDAWPDRESVQPDVGWQWSTSSSLSAFIGLIEGQLIDSYSPFPSENGGVAL